MIDLQKARLATYPVRIEMSTLFLHLYESMTKKRSEKETAIMFAVNSIDRHNLASKSIYPRAATNLNSALEVIDVTAKTSLSEKRRRTSMIGTMSNPVEKEALINLLALTLHFLIHLIHKYVGKRQRDISSAKFRQVTVFILYSVSLHLFIHLNRSTSQKKKHFAFQEHDIGQRRKE